MADAPYILSPFEWITDVHWGGSNYLLITVVANLTTDGTTPPSVPTVSLTLASDAKLITKQEKHNSEVIPPTGKQTIYFLWLGEAQPFPTPDNYENGVVTGLNRFGQRITVTYSEQFNVFWAGQDAESLPSLSMAEMYADDLNRGFQGVISVGGQSGVSFFPPESTPSTAATNRQAFVNPTDWFGAQLTVPTKDKGSSAVNFGGQYLISIPAGTDLNSVSVQMPNVTGIQIAEVGAAVYAGYTGKATIEALTAVTPDAQASGLTSATFITTAKAKGKGTVEAI